MKALILAHDHMSPAGPVQDRLIHHGFDTDYRVVVPQESFRSPNVVFDYPDRESFDVIVTLGAPWGAWDDEKIGHWLLPEIQWVRNIVTSGQPMLGICFGGQVMARALGGTVAPAQKNEIGWHEVWSDRDDIIPTGRWFQFHYDRFTVPPGAVEIARNPAASQGFIAERSLGVQFHPELVTDTLVGWLDGGGWKSLEKDGQDGQVMISQTRAYEADAIVRTNALVDGFLRHVAKLTLPTL